MLRTLALTSLGAAIFAATALAAAGVPAGLTAAAKGSTVTIVNHSTKTVKGFFINSTDKPKITATSDKSCKIGTSPWKAAGKKHVDYWADCSDSLAPGKVRVIKLTMSGSGTVYVWAKIGTTQVKLATGN